MLFALSLLLLTQALAIEAGLIESYLTGGKPGNDIEALCNGEAIDLTTYEQLEQLNTAVGQSKCAPHYEDEIRTLALAIAKSKSDLCSPESIDAFVSYYKRFVDTSSDRAKELDSSLKRLALAYGLQTSNRCKKNMVKVLTEDNGKLLAEASHELVGKFISDYGPVDNVLSQIGGPDELLLPGDLAPLLKRRGLKEKAFDEKMFMQTKTGKYIKQVQSICQHRFKPVYGPLMLPLVKLANIGVNYKDKTLKKDLKDKVVLKELNKWSRIVFMCEVLANLHIVENKADKELAEGTDAQLVRLVTREEAEAIEGQGVDTDDAMSLEVEHFDYKPEERVSLEGAILDRSDKRLVHAIKSVKTDKSEDEIIAKRVENMALGQFKGHLRKGHIRLLFSSALKTVKREYRGGEVISPSEALVKSMNDLAASESNGSEGTVGMSQDTFNIIMNFVFAVVVIGVVCGISALAILAAHGVFG